jgi:hypothetical protein
MEKHRLRGSECRVLSKIFGPKREEGARGDCTVRSFIICTAHQKLFG